MLDVWRRWAREVNGRGLASSHFLVEDQPEQVVDALFGLLERQIPALDRS